MNTCSGRTRSGDGCRNPVAQAGANCGRCRGVAGGGDGSGVRADVLDADNYVAAKVTDIVGDCVDDAVQRREEFSLLAELAYTPSWNERSYTMAEAVDEDGEVGEEGYEKVRQTLASEATKERIREAVAPAVEERRKELERALGQPVEFDDMFNVVDGDGETILELSEDGDTWHPTYDWDPTSKVAFRTYMPEDGLVETISRWKGEAEQRRTVG